MSQTEIPSSVSSLTVRSGWPVYTSPPDGGYGWVVVLSSFILQMISLGVSLSGGVYYVELLEAFNSGKGVTAWIGSLNTGLLFGAGKYWITRAMITLIRVVYYLL